MDMQGKVIAEAILLKTYWITVLKISEKERWLYLNSKYYAYNYLAPCEVPLS